TLAKERVNLEFVSANPTGPVHLGHTRWAALGDALRRLLEAAGADVTSEHYVNDAGVQMLRFAESVLAAANGEPTPPAGYPGDYIADVARTVLAEAPDLVDLPYDEAVTTAQRLGYQAMLAEMKTSLQRFGVEFDVWFSEASMHESGAVGRAIDTLRTQ